jgi:hypothetical protein
MGENVEGKNFFFRETGGINIVFRPNYRPVANSECIVKILCTFYDIILSQFFTKS